MKEINYKSIVSEASFGFSFNEIVKDKSGNPLDYRVLDVNHLFEEITALKSSQIIGRKATEVFSDNTLSGEDLLQLVRNADQKGSSETGDYYSEHLKRYYRLQLISAEPGYFSILFDDITCFKHLENELDKSGTLLAENKRLSQISKTITESELSYRSIFDHATDAIYVLDRECTFIDVNPAALKMYGYERDELVGKKPDSVSAPGRNDLDLTLKFINSAFDGKSQRFEFWGWRKNGEEFPKEIILNKGLYFGREVVFAMARDITERKRFENALKASEANLIAIIENTLESIWSIDTNYNIRYVNEVFKEAFFQSFGVALNKGTNIIESLPESLRELWRKRYDRAFKNEHFVFEDRIDLGDSAVYIEVAMNPIVVDGLVVGASFYGKNVTEKKLAQIQLQYQADLRKILIELSSGFINLPVKEVESAINHSLTRIGEFVGADRAYVFDYDFVSLTATNTFEWCRTGIDPFKEKLQAVNVTDLEDWVRIHKSGEVVKVDDVSAMPLGILKQSLEEQKILSLLTIPLMQEGECIGFVGFDSVLKKHIYSDYEQQLLQVYAQTLVNVKERLIKEQKLITAKEKAEVNDRLKSAFLANMSHEIRTPMNGIIGFLDLLKEPDLSEENKAVYINIVTQSGHRLLDTINDIIEISRIEAGEVSVTMSEVNCSELLGYYHGFFRQQADQKGLNYTISNQLPGGIRSFQTDRNKLECIITNLIKNAIKFTHSGSVEFGCSMEGDNLLFHIKDTGVGIPEDRIEAIFDRFVQADISSSRMHEGSGLGLSIVKAYIEILNGKMMVESEPGKGSTFSFSIPFIQSKQVDSKNVNAVISNGINITNAKILIAEDDPASYLYLEKLLAGKGIILLHTTNGEDTVRMVRANPDISIILMDVRMEGMSGLEATEQIRLFNKNIPIIAQTAYSLGGDRERALEAGCSDYISKPVNRMELNRIVNKYIIRVQL
jgi:PAS domain S-box-containing protein